MTDLKLTFACGPYDRFEAIKDGTIRPNGIDLKYLPIDSPRDIFDRMVLHREFDLSELSASEFVTLHCNADRPFVALPVFPSKVFRHSFIFVNAKAGITSAKQLEGKRVGVPLYTMTAAIYIRGLLAEDYGVDITKIHWIQGAMDKAGTHGEARELASVGGVKLQQNNSGKSLDELLTAGEIDAFIGPQTPGGFASGKVVRLFPDFHEREKAYFTRTGIHPIMHLVAIQRSVYEKNPWIGKPLYDAFLAAKDHAWSELRHSGAHRSMLPWIYSNVQEVADVMGEDPWPYGVENNRRTLEALVRYLHGQGIISRSPSLEELFVPVG